jgi:spore coat protein H
MKYKFLLTLLAVCTSLLAADKTKKADKSDKFFESTDVLQIKIEIPPEGIATLAKYQFQFGGGSTERQSVNVTVREGKDVYTNVALHLKGAAGSFRPITDNPAMTLNFDKNAKNQKFHGLEKLSLNNSVQDPTLVSEQFCRELFLKVGVPTPRATHATVELNGKDLGVYVLVEGFNKQFLKKHFKDANGHLYDGGFVKDIDAELALNSGDNPKDQSDRKALVEAAREPDLKKRLGRLEQTLDLDRFLTYIALDVMLWDWDGYAQNRNNWRLYHDPSTEKMVFIPHGMDQMFWKPEGSLLPRLGGMVAKSVLQIPELRARYFDKIRELRSSVFQTESLTNRARAIAAKVSPVLKQKDPDKAREQEKELNKFCAAIERRVKSIDDQLATPITPLKFAGNNSITLAKWESKTNFGHPFMSKAPGEGAEVLKLGAADGSSIGTWNTKVWLEPGKYKVEGRVKTKDIVADVGDPRAGAGLRVARNRPENYTPGTSDWKNISSEFSIDDPISEVQIVCEFRGASGEASFDSIKLSLVEQKEK